jgi:hypothetical protein
MGKTKDKRFENRDAFLTWARVHNFQFIDALEDNGQYVRYQYARGPGVSRYAPKPNEPWIGESVIQPGPIVGVFIGFEGADGQLRFGWSVRHPKKEGRPFCKVEGLYRAIKKIPCVNVSDLPMRPDGHIQRQYVSFVLECARQCEERRNRSVAVEAK